MKHFNIYLIRHGQSCGNLEQDAISQPIDSPLSDHGFVQAEALYSRFKKEGIEFEKIFSSSFKRAIQTTQMVFPHLKDKVSYHNELVEYCAGDWKGESRSKIFSDIKNVEKFSSLQMGFPFPNGESLKQVERRMSSFVENNIIYNKDLSAKVNDKKVNVAIVSHGQAIKCLLAGIMGFDGAFCWRIRIENTSITKLKYHPNKGWYLRYLNDTKHLQ